MRRPKAGVNRNLSGIPWSQHDSGITANGHGTGAALPGRKNTVLTTVFQEIYGELMMTETELNAIAADAIVGFSFPATAKGIATAL